MDNKKLENIMDDENYHNLNCIFIREVSPHNLSYSTQEEQESILKDVVKTISTYINASKYDDVVIYHSSSSIKSIGIITDELLDDLEDITVSYIKDSDLNCKPGNYAKSNMYLDVIKTCSEEGCLPIVVSSETYLSSLSFHVLANYYGGDLRTLNFSDVCTSYIFEKDGTIDCITNKNHSSKGL